MNSKMVLIMIYFSILFIICRIFDIALKTRELKSLSFIPTHLMVNPVKLSVNHLKRLLDYRGINYVGLVEKKELQSLVEASGNVNKEEIEDIDEESEENEMTNEVNQVTTILSGTHFYELVEDAKDSVWLILVRAKYGTTWFDRTLWRNLLKMASKYGIRIGVFDCFQDWKFCESKNWQNTHLLLAMPRNGLKSKEDVLFVTHYLTEKTSVKMVFNWIHRELGSRVKKISSMQELDSEWLQKSSLVNSNEIKLIYISTLVDVPLVLSTLAIKFSGRIKFGAFKLNAKNGTTKIFSNHDGKLPLIVIVFSNSNIYIYNRKSGECFNYRSLELFLKSMRPEMNDVFLITLILLNSSLGLELFWIRRRKLWQHFVSWPFNFIKSNIIFFLIWLVIMTLSSFPFMDQLICYLLHFCQHLASTQIASIIRYDLHHYFYPSLLILSYLLTGLSVIIFNSLFSWNQQESDNDDDTFSFDWNHWESTLLTLFRPIGMNISSLSSLSFEDHLELRDAILIERLAIPNLWLQPEIVSNEYVNQLPVWKYLDQDKDRQNVESDDTISSHLTTSHDNLNCDETNKFKSISTIFKNMLLCKECAICLDEYKSNDLICGLPCSHNYHQKCIMNWINLNNHCCPKCRRPTYKFKSS